MPYPHRDFFILNKRSRFLPDGTEVKPRKGDKRLIVSSVEYRWHRTQMFGKILFGDGTSTKEFLINRDKPTYFATIALNFRKWFYGNQAKQANDNNGGENNVLQSGNATGVRG
jgi:hypothetical protein